MIQIDEFIRDGSIVRRSPCDENEILTQIAYTPNENTNNADYVRTVERAKLFRRSPQVIQVMTDRRALMRFGDAKGAQGLERGISMVAQDEVLIEDPLSEDANKTGEERLIERIQATVKQKGPRRMDNDGDDFESYLRASSSSNSRSNSNSKYRNSPNRYRNNNNGGRNSPAFMRNSNRSPNRSPARNMPQQQQQQKKN